MHIKYERQMHPFFSFTHTPSLLTGRSCITRANTLHQENEDLQQSESVTHTLPWWEREDTCSATSEGHSQWSWKHSPTHNVHKHDDNAEWCSWCQTWLRCDWKERGEATQICEMLPFENGWMLFVAHRHSTEMALNLHRNWYRNANEQSQKNVSHVVITYEWRKHWCGQNRWTHSQSSNSTKIPTMNLYNASPTDTENDERCKENEEKFFNGEDNAKKLNLSHKRNIIWCRSNSHKHTKKSLKSKSPETNGWQMMSS